jgi:hypothetical protein
MAVSPDTEVRLLSVPFNNGYKNQMDFDSLADQTNYMFSVGNMTFDNFTYQRQERSLKVPANIDTILNCNYVMYQNSNYNSKWFYAFVTAKRYINPHTTELIIETDVFQTWQFDIELKHSFIDRQHNDRWNSDGTPVLNTVDEGLEYGTEYDVVNVDHYHPQGGVYFLVIASKKTLHKPAGAPEIVSPTLNGIVQPLSFYIHPFRPDGGTPPTKIDGTTVSMTTLHNLLTTIYSDTSAVNNVVSLCVTDYLGFDTNYAGNSVDLDGMFFTHETIGDSGVPIIQVENMPSYETTSKNFGDKYSDYVSVDESKLLMYPYTVLSIVDGKGNTVDLKNEFINGTDINLVARGSIGTSNKVAYYVDGYLQSTSEANGHVTNFNHALINNDVNDVPIITDLLSAYLQGNKNTLATQKASNTFNKKMDLLSGGMGLGQNVIGGARSGGGLGALEGLVGGGLGLIKNQGNHDIQIAQLMNKQKDISNVPPSLSNLGSNTFFDYGNGLNGVYLVKKQIKLEYRNRLTDYFKMYGTKIHKVQLPNYKTRKYYNYIKTVGVNIQGDVPSEDMSVIKSMFDNGVTIWHTEDVGNYALVNDEV